jgi:hypothetical protein
MSRIDELKREAQAMQSYLEVNVGGGNVDEYIDRLDTLGVYYARSGAMHAEVVGLIGSTIAKFMGDNVELLSKISPSLGQKMLKGATAELDGLERWIDRINASCNKQCDNLRTLISYEKQRAQIL